MSVVVYRCPSTGDEVSTSIQASTDTLLRMRDSRLAIWVWCPHCMGGHQIGADEARIQSAPLDPLTVWQSAEN